MADSSKSVPPSGAPTLQPQGQQAGKPGLPLNRPFTLVGARNRAHLHLLSTTVSRNHACIVRSSNGGLYIRDMASRSGVILNGRRVKERELNDGDSLQIGSFKFKLAEPNGAFHPNETAAPGPAILERDGTTLESIDGRTVLIGRRPNCDVSIDSPTVSNTHAIIFENDGRRVIRDLGSRTGTIVNGTPVHQQILEFGDTLRIGETTFRYLSSEAAEAPLSAEDLIEAAPQEVEPVAAGPAHAEPAGSDDDRIPLDFYEDAPPPAATAGRAVDEIHTPLPVSDVLEPVSDTPEIGFRDPEPLDELEAHEEVLPQLPLSVEPESSEEEEELAPESIDAVPEAAMPAHHFTAPVDVIESAAASEIDFAETDPAPQPVPQSSDEILDELEETPLEEISAEPDDTLPAELTSSPPPEVLPVEHDAAPATEHVIESRLEETALPEAAPEPEPDPELDREPETDIQTAAEVNSAPTDSVAEPAEELELATRGEEQPVADAIQPPIEDFVPVEFGEPSVATETPSAPLRVEDVDLSAVRFTAETVQDALAEAIEPSAVVPAPLLDLVPPPGTVELTAATDVLGTQAVTDIEPPAGKSKRKPRPRKTPRRKQTPNFVAETSAEETVPVHAPVPEAAPPVVEDVVAPAPQPEVVTPDADELPTPEVETVAPASEATPVEPDVSLNAAEDRPHAESESVSVTGDDFDLPADKPEPVAIEEISEPASALSDMAFEQIEDRNAPVESAPEPESPAPEEDWVEVLDVTEPTLESALNLGRKLGASDSSAEGLIISGSNPDLSDTAFGRAVQEFSGGESGNLVEESGLPEVVHEEIGVGPAAVDSPQTPESAEPIEPREPTEAQPQPEAAESDEDFLAAIDSELASSEISLPADPAIEFAAEAQPDFSGKIDAEHDPLDPAAPHTLSSGVLSEDETVVDSTDALADDFSLSAPESLTTSLDLGPPPQAPEVAAPKEDPLEGLLPVDEILFDESNELSLEPPLEAVPSEDFLPETEAPAEPVAERVAEPAPVPPPAAPQSAPPKVTPGAAPVDPYFGMTRDLGSFIGGMPLALAPNAPSAADLRKPAPSPQSAASAVAEIDENLFDADEPLELFDETAEKLDALPDSLDEIGDVTKALADAAPAPAPAPPARQQQAPSQSLRSLTADPSSSGPKPAAAPAPAVPPFVGGRTAARRTTNSFQGLAAPPVRATDVFSNTAFPASTAAMFRPQPVDDIAPIVARHSNPAPSSAGAIPPAQKPVQKPNLASPARVVPDATETARTPSKPGIDAPSDDHPGGKKKPWWKKLLVLLPLMLGAIIAAVMVIMLFFPPRRFVEGTLQLNGLDNLNVMARKEQVRGLRDSLRKPDLKNVVAGNLQVQGVTPGFAQTSLDTLADPENSPFDEKRGALVLRRGTTDPAGDSKRMQAVLLAVYKENQTPAEEAAAARKALQAARNERNDLEQQLAIGQNAAAKLSDEIKLAAPPDIEAMMADPADALTALQLRDGELRKSVDAATAAGNAVDARKAYDANQNLMKLVAGLKEAQDRSVAITKSLSKSQTDLEALTTRANSAAVLGEPDETATRIVNEQDQRFWYVIVALGAIVAVFAAPIFLAIRDPRPQVPAARVMTQGYAVQGRDADEFLLDAIDTDEHPATA